MNLFDLKLLFCKFTDEDDNRLNSSGNTKQSSNQLLSLSNPFTGQTTGADIYKVTPKVGFQIIKIISFLIFFKK